MTDTKKSPPAWAAEENHALVALYFTMLDAASAGKPYSKAAMIREIRGDNAGLPNIRQDFPLHKRSRASIEFKLMNATAAHRDIDPNAETMHGHGYRAMPNYQATLKTAMLDELSGRAEDAAKRAVYGVNPVTGAA